MAERVADGLGVDDLDGNLYLALALLELAAGDPPPRGDGGAWRRFAPYFAILPRRLPHFPLFWADAELEALAPRRCALVSDASLAAFGDARWLDDFAANRALREANRAARDAEATLEVAASEHGLNLLSAPSTLAVVLLRIHGRAE